MWSPREAADSSSRQPRGSSATEGVGGDDRVGHGVSGHDERFMVNRLAVGHAALGDLANLIRGRIGQADLGEGDGKSHRHCEGQYFVEVRTRSTFEHHLGDQPE